MILQALYEYYQRKPDLPREGFENVRLKFVIVIKKDGTFVDLVDKREGKQGKEYLLPKAKGRAGSKSWQTTFLLWDHYGYVLGHPKDDKKASIEMAKKQHKVFVDSIKDLPEKLKKDKGVKAVLDFYESNQEKEVKKHANWAECSKVAGCNLSFQLDGDIELIPQRPIVSEYQSAMFSRAESEENNEEGTYEAACLITGKRGPIARLHTATPILGSKSNAKLVGIQKNSGFDSYYKEQAFNAPVSLSAESAYSTALKYLLNSDANKVLIADSTTVFWAQKKSKSFDLEKQFPWYISDSKDNPDRNTQAVKALYEAAYSGKLPLEEGNQFYVLGLSPNAARISVRFWRTGTVREFAEKIKMHFDDFNIIRSPFDPEYLSLYRILSSTALQYKMENVAPNTAGAVIESILDGTPYPITLLHQCIRRIRAEQKVTHPRAAILKAFINRSNRNHKSLEKEVAVSLDRTNTSPGYLLGRLFSVLEQVQNAANNYKELNAGIRDRFYGAFSSTPITVLPLLEKLYGHHLGKIEKSKGFFERIKGEIIDKLNAQNIPAHLTMEQQALFAIGYYHQRQEFFTGKKGSGEPELTKTSGEEEN